MASTGGAVRSVAHFPLHTQPSCHFGELPTHGRHASGQRMGLRYSANIGNVAPVQAVPVLQRHLCLIFVTAARHTELPSKTELNIKLWLVSSRTKWRQSSSSNLKRPGGYYCTLQCWFHLPLFCRRPCLTWTAWFEATGGGNLGNRAAEQTADKGLGIGGWFITETVCPVQEVGGVLDCVRWYGCIERYTEPNVPSYRNFMVTVPRATYTCHDSSYCNDSFLLNYSRVDKIHHSQYPVSPREMQADVAQESAPPLPSAERVSNTHGHTHIATECMAARQRVASVGFLSYLSKCCP
ncbi:hypothetical protein JOM56_012584 [Amanita muscaria]